jgi:transcriptional regulator with XRE-family HTH domain
MKGIYFEEKGLALLKQRGITKSEFARRMGIQRQNVNVLFKTNNLEIIARAAEVLDVPLALLVGYVDEPDVCDLPIIESCISEQSDDYLEIRPEDVPVGDSVEDRRTRNRLIRKFYFHWMARHEDRKVFNKTLNDYIHIKYISVNETAGHASLRYLSTLAVLQLDAILPNAVLKDSKPANTRTKNQKGFKRMLIMEYNCPAIGMVRLTVGQKASDDSKVQYCITAIDVHS